MKKDIKSKEDELIDFALAELEKTFDNLGKGKPPEFSSKLNKLMNELGKVSDKEMTDDEVKAWTEKTSKKLGLE